MRELMKIKVTRADIQQGEAGNSQECAISLALQRHFKTNNTYVSGSSWDDAPVIKVDDKQLKVSEKDVYNVSTFIDLFDDYVIIGDDVAIDETCIPQPFEFEIK